MVHWICSTWGSRSSHCNCNPHARQPQRIALSPPKKKAVVELSCRGWRATDVAQGFFSLIAIMKRTSGFRRPAGAHGSKVLPPLNHLKTTLSSTMVWRPGRSLDGRYLTWIWVHAVPMRTPPPTLPPPPPPAWLHGRTVKDEGTGQRRLQGQYEHARRGRHLTRVLVALDDDAKLACVLFACQQVEAPVQTVMRIALHAFTEFTQEVSPHSECE